MNSKFFLQNARVAVSKIPTGTWVRLYGSGGLAMYATPCAGGCGEPILCWMPKIQMQFKCKECRERESREKREIKSELATLAKTNRLINAKELIKKQFGAVNIYDKPLMVIEKAMNQDGWFQSTGEILAAAELIRTRTKARPQVQFGKWRVDYVLPNLKVLLEIDGMHHNNPERIGRDRRRDAAILNMLEYGWIFVRVKEVTIKENLKSLMPIIRQAMDKNKFKKV